MQMVRMWWADSRGKVAVLLFLLWILYLSQQFQWVNVVSVLVALGSSIGCDLVFGKIRFGTWKFSLSSVVTGLLVGMIMDPPGGLLPVSLASFLAVVSKHLFKKPQGKHIFNPAGFGIVIASLLFNRPVAWWAVSWGWMPAVIIMLWMVMVLTRLRRLWMPSTFLIIYIVSLLPSTGLFGSLWSIFDGTVCLFAFVMLAEPVTSPAMGRWRYGWGLLVGGLVVVQNILGQSVTDPLLLGLLGANALAFVVVKIKSTP